MADFKTPASLFVVAKALIVCQKISETLGKIRLLEVTSAACFLQLCNFDQFNLVPDYAQT